MIIYTAYTALEPFTFRWYIVTPAQSDRLNTHALFWVDVLLVGIRLEPGRQGGVNPHLRALLPLPGNPSGPAGRGLVEAVWREL